MQTQTTKNVSYDTSIILLIDSREYVQFNCFQHQLAYTLVQMYPNLVVTELEGVQNTALNPDVDILVVVCLKQRSIYDNIDAFARFLNGKRYAFYDQDPWNAFMDDSPYKGAYDLMKQRTNLNSICLTS